MNIFVESRALKYALSKAPRDFRRLKKLLEAEYLVDNVKDDWFEISVAKLKLSLIKGSWDHFRTMKILRGG